MKKFIKLAAAAAMLAGTLALAPTAQASDTAVTCVVNGSVKTNFVKYDFVDTAMRCTGLFNGAADVAEYIVTASGNTQSFPTAGGPESCSAGQNLGNGTLTANRSSTTTGAAPASLSSSNVTFVRAEGAVLAQGTLTGFNHSVAFTAPLAFAPTNPSQVAQCTATGGTPPSLDAALVGTAVVG